MAAEGSTVYLNARPGQRYPHLVIHWTVVGVDAVIVLVLICSVVFGLLVAWRKQRDTLLHQQSGP